MKTEPCGGNPLREKAQQGFRGYPIAEIAYYGSNDKLVTRVVVNIVNENDKIISFENWYSEEHDIRFDEAATRQIVDFIECHNALSVVVTERYERKKLAIPSLELSDVEKLKVEGNIEGLTKALVYKRDCVRREAATALGEIGGQLAVEPLIAILTDDPSLEVRQAAAKALDKLGWQPHRSEPEVEAAYWTTKQQADLQRFLNLVESVVNYDEKLGLTKELVARFDDATYYEDHVARITEMWPKVRPEAQRQGLVVDAPLQFALKKFKSGGKPGEVVACLSPDRIGKFDFRKIIGTSYELCTENPQPKHILQCWQYRNGQWENLPAKQYIGFQSTVGSEWTEFSILEKHDVAFIVWQWLALVIKGQLGGQGGTWVLKKIGNEWLFLPHLSQFWLI